MKMENRIQIKVISNTENDDAKDVETEVNYLSDNEWLMDSKLTTPTRIIMQKWIPNEDNNQ